MPLFKAVKYAGSVGQNKYYPQVTTHMDAAGIDQIADYIEAQSTVSKVDIVAVLNALPKALTNAFNQGRNVKLAGFGSFSLVINPKKGSGKDNAKDVSVSDIESVKLRFTPESSWNYNHTVLTRAVIDGLEWVKVSEAAAQAAADTPAADTEQQTGGTTEEENPYDPFAG